MAGTPAFILAGGSAIAGLVAAVMLARWVMAQDAGPEIIQKVGRLIQQGAMAFLRREYTILAVFVAVVTVVIAVLIDFNVTDNATIAATNAAVQERFGTVPGPRSPTCSAPSAPRGRLHRHDASPRGATCAPRPRPWTA